MTPVWQFLLAGVGTYLLRVSAIALVGRGVVMSPRAERTIRLIGPAVLGAIVANSLFFSGGQANLRPSWYIGALVAAAVVYRFRSAAWAMGAAMVAVWAMQQMGF